MGVAPGTVVFGRDMLFHIPVLSGFNITRESRQVVIDDKNLRQNIKNNFKGYNIRDDVLLVTYDLSSLQGR